MNPKNGYIIIEDATDEESKIEMPESVGEAIRKGRIIFTSVEAEEKLELKLHKHTEEQPLTIYYRAAEGHIFPDADFVAIPYKAVIAIV